MFSYAYMKILELAPRSYERRMNRLSRGRLARLHGQVAALARPGWRVLDLGCGAGGLAVLMAQGGVQVLGIDQNPAMVRQARARAAHAHAPGRLSFQRLDATDLGALPTAGFEAVTCVLMFGELAGRVRGRVLAQCWRVLAPGGILAVADEITPRGRLARAACHARRLPQVALAFLATGRLTRPLTGFETALAQAGFTNIGLARDAPWSLGLFTALKPREAA